MIRKPKKRTRLNTFLPVQFFSLVGIASWLLADPFAARTVLAAPEFVSAGMQAAPQTDADLFRCLTLVMVLTVAAASLMWELQRLFRRTKRSPTIRNMMTLTAVVAMWLFLSVNYQRVAWQGKRLRSTRHLEAVARLADRLNNDWPGDAGDIVGVGPFTAYPFGTPTLLLLLSPYPLESTNTVITSIERGDNGSLRFELGGDDGGDWIEWHPDGSRPNNFAGGLDDQYFLTRYTRLDDQWFLVSYRSRNAVVQGEQDS